MDRKELLESIRLLRSKANQGKLIVFVGAGVSQNVEEMPSWGQLIQKMAEAIGYSKCEKCRHKKENCEESCAFKKEYSQDEYLKIPQFVYNEDSALYTQIITDNVSDAEIDVPLSQAIFALNPTHIITTNYDKLLESSSDIRRENYDVIVCDRDLLTSKKNKYIIKMHGDISELDTIVLKEADYLAYSQYHVLIEMFVKALLSDHTILFLGYSLNDYNIKLIIGWLNFIRSQNDVLGSETRVGYIVRDDDQISRDEIKYFESNNIGVINLREMPLIKNIPTKLQNPIGKRLYSFLNTISDVSSERCLGASLLYADAVELLSSFRYVDIGFICECLCLKDYFLQGYRMILYQESAYDEITAYLSLSDVGGLKLKKIFAGAGITEICLQTSGPQSKNKIYHIEATENAIFHNPFFLYYIRNDYIKLDDLCKKSEENDWRAPCFYQSMITGYSTWIESRYSRVDAAQLSIEEKIAFLFNSTTLDAACYRKNFSTDKSRQYISGLANLRIQRGFKLYEDVFEGNTKRLRRINEHFKKLQDHYFGNTTYIGTRSLEEFYNIQRIAMEVYWFYFCNGLFFVAFTDLKSIMKRYVEAIICTNGEYDAPRQTIWGMGSPKEKYAIGTIDFNIMTKLISVKELQAILDEYNIKNFRTIEGFGKTCIEYLSNLRWAILNCNSEINLSMVMSTFINTIVLMQYFNLSNEEKEETVSILKDLLCDKTFSNYFFSTRCPEHRTALKALLNLMKKVDFSESLDIAHVFFGVENMQNYIVNSNVYLLQEFISITIGNGTEGQVFIKKVVEEYSIENRIRIIRLIRSAVFDEQLKSDFQAFLSENFASLRNDDILDFAFHDWLPITDVFADNLIEDALVLKKEQIAGYHVYPDPLESKLELIYLLYLTDRIKDISKLQPLTDESDYLRFFFNDPTLDYSKIDFSNYMWQNIARNPMCIPQIKEHKQEIIPGLKRRVEIETASEFEKKLLYGVLVDNVFTLE